MNTLSRYFKLPSAPPNLQFWEEKWSCGPDPTAEMISRRRILSRSRDELNFGEQYNQYDEEEDVWFNRDKLFKDHIQEILNKWDQIDDEIWAKIICMERNRRVAKAYARAPILTINGSDDGFDGYRIGLNGFDNPMRDVKTEEVKGLVNQGVKVKMDDAGNILIKRITKANVYIKGWLSDNPETSTSVSNEIIRLNGLLEYEKAVKLFDMKKFQSNVSRELRRAYPDRRKLESQCISCVAFVKDASDVLDLPTWVMIINIVAMDMLKSKLPPISKRQSVPNLVSIFERTKQAIPEEDPYSLPGNNSSSTGSRSSSGHYVSTNGGLPNQKSSDAKPPKLPPRDFERREKISKSKNKNKKDASKAAPQPDYDEENIYSLGQIPKFDDPYYCGFSARVPNYAKRSTVPMPQSSYSPSRQYDPSLQMRKVPSNGFLNGFLRKGPQHSRSASYHSFYGGSLGDSEPYTGSSADGGMTDDTMYDPTYGRVNVQLMHRFNHQNHYNNRNHNPHNNYPNNSKQLKPVMRSQEAAGMPQWAYNSRDRTYCGEWDG